MKPKTYYIYIYIDAKPNMFLILFATDVATVTIIYINFHDQNEVWCRDPIGKNDSSLRIHKVDNSDNVTLSRG